MFDKFSTGNFYLREQGTGNREHTKNNQIQSPPLTRGGLGWGQIIFDTLIMTYQTSSKKIKIIYSKEFNITIYFQVKLIYYAA